MRRKRGMKSEGISRRYYQQLLGLAHMMLWKDHVEHDRKCICVRIKSSDSNASHVLARYFDSCP